MKLQKKSMSIVEKYNSNNYIGNSFTELYLEFQQKQYHEIKIF